MAISLNGTTGVDTPGLAVDTDTLYIDRVNNRVGIGTSSPESNLSVIGGISAEGSSAYVNASGPNAAFFLSRNNAQSEGSPIMWIFGSSNGTAFASLGTGMGEIRAACPATFSGGASLSFYADEQHTSESSGAGLVLRTTPNGTNSLTERMRITSDGNVGVGTSVPGGDSSNRVLALNASTSSSLFFKVGDTQYSYLRGEAAILQIGTNAAIPIQMVTNNIERMRIAANGNIEVGTPGGSGSKGLYSYSQTISDNESAYIGCDAKTGESNWRSVYIFVEKHSGITNPVGVLELYAEDGASNLIWADNSDQLRISTTRSHIGTTSGTVVGAQTSDERVKNISGPVEYGLPEIMALEPIAFTMKDDVSKTPKIGFSAQQVQPIIPEAVFDTDIEIEEGQPTKLGMEYVSLIPVLVKAIQEQQEIIQSLTARIEALENA